MVQIARTVKVIPRIVVAGRGVAVVGALVVAANVCQGPRHGVAFPRFGREVAPIALAVAVINHHVFNNAGAFALKGVNHGAQLGSGAKRTVVVEPPHGRITHVGVLTIARLRHPNQIEILRKLVGLRSQHRPFRFAEAIPIKALQHHTAIIGRPTGSHRLKCQQKRCEGKKNAVHSC